MGRLYIPPPTSALRVIKTSALHPNDSKLASPLPIKLLVLGLFQWDLLEWEDGGVLGWGRMTLLPVAEGWRMESF